MDVIEDILARLPVKSLLRFTCVCKAWYSLISDPRFSKSLHHRMRPSILISDELVISTLTIESLLERKDRAFTSHSLPWKEPYNYDVISSRNIILGSCNGLVCVEHQIVRGSCRHRSGLFLWNPSTKKFKVLPYPGCYELSFQSGSFTCAWFGYDELIDDYKLVLLYCSGLSSSPVIAKLYVFTLKSNTWRSSPVDHIALSGMHESIGGLCNGAIHWIKSNSFPDDAGECILALDLATEKFGLLKFSHAAWGLHSWVGSLVDGCLCLCTHGDGEDVCYVTDLWVMKEYGVESSWTKLLSIPNYDFLWFHPILFSNEGKKIVAMCKHWVEDPGCGEILKFRVEGASKVGKFEETLLEVPRLLCQHYVFLHMEESLVSLN